MKEKSTEKKQGIDLKEKIIAEVGKNYPKIDGPVELLRLVRRHLKLSIDQKEIYKEKGNFQKSLEGDRAIKTEYMLTIEELAKKSLYEIYKGDEAKFKTPKDYEHRGIKFYVAQGTYEAMEELAGLVDGEGYPVLEAVDEFGKDVVDYIIELENTEGLKYLSKNVENSTAFNPYHNNANQKFSLALDMVFKADDVSLFNYMSTWNKHLEGDYLKIICEEENLRRILESENIFKAQLKWEEQEWNDNYGWYIEGKKPAKLVLVSPLLSRLLFVALKNVSKYREQIREILSVSQKATEEICKALAEVEGRSSFRINDKGDISSGYNGFCLGRCMRTEGLSCEDSYINSLLEENERRIEEIKNKVFFDKERILSGKAQTIDGKTYMCPSENHLEYEFYKFARENGIMCVPEYLGRENDVDVFKSYKSGGLTARIDDSDRIESLAEFFKSLHDKCEDKLGKGKVYRHAGIRSDYIYFDYIDICCVSGWEKCVIGTRAEALKDILISLIIGASTSEPYALYLDIQDFMKAYSGDGGLLDSFGTELKKDTAEKIEKLKGNKDKYDLYNLAELMSMYHCRLALAEAFEEELNKL